MDLPKHQWKTESRHFHSLLFLALLSMDIHGGDLFVKLVHFRALSGWASELDFDSLLFHWRWVNNALFLLNFLAWTGALLGLFVEGFYRLYGAALSLAFLADAVYPWCLAFHYVRSFHFILLLGILANAYGFAVLAFGKERTGMLGEIPEEVPDHG